MNQRQWIPIEDSTETNSRRVQMIPVVFTLVVTVVFLIIGLIIGFPVIGVVLGAAMAGLFMFNVHRTAEAVVLKMVGGLSASDHEHARLFNVVDGLCVVGGDARPALRVVGIEYPVALAVGMPGSSGTIVVSAGFLRSMGRVEMEAVLAHLMWRLRTNDIGVTTYMLALSVALQRVGGQRLAEMIASRLCDERSIMWADIAACQVTRYPPALVSALEIVERSSSVPVGRIGAQPLWFATPDASNHASGNDGRITTLEFVLPSLAERIAFLKEI